MIYPNRRTGGAWHPNGLLVSSRSELWFDERDSLYRFNAVTGELQHPALPVAVLA
jgi:hypothetical protein